MSDALTLDATEIGLLEQARNDGLLRGLTMLSTMTFRWEDLVKQGVGHAVSVGSAGHDAFGSGGGSNQSGDYANASGKFADVAEDAIMKLLSKVWKQVEARVIGNEIIKKCCEVLGVGVGWLLNWIKGSVLSGKLVAQLVPFYGAVKGAYDGIILAVETHGHRTAFESLKAMAPQIGSGFPTVAMKSFTTYVRTEAIRAGAKSAYTFAKTIAQVLIDIFSAGVSSIVSFATSVVEAVVSFAYSVIQAVLFHRATDKARTCLAEKGMMEVDDFRDVLKGAPFVGAVFFAAANYIGHFNLTSLLTRDDRTIAPSSLMAAVSSVGQAQKLACGYMAASHFEVGFRDAESRARYGWLLEMMSGYASDAPKSDFLTANATNWQRFKHKAKKFKYRFL